MQIRRVKIFPYLLFYTDRLQEGFAGCANAFVLRIRPAYKNDVGLESHEATHVRQWYRTLGFHSLLYLISNKYKLFTELEAYREQLKYPPASEGDIDWFRRKYAIFLSEKYDLGITIEEAYQKLG